MSKYQNLSQCELTDDIHSVVTAAVPGMVWWLVDEPFLKCLDYETSPSGM